MHFKGNEAWGIFLFIGLICVIPGGLFGAIIGFLFGSGWVGLATGAATSMFVLYGLRS